MAYQGASEPVRAALRQAMTEAGRQLLARLAAAGPPELTAAAAPPATRITAGGLGPLIGCSFAPDGTEVAVTRWYDRPAALPRCRRFTTLYALPGGRRRHRFPDAEPVPHLGRAIVAYVSAYDAGAARVRRYTPEHGREDLLIQARAGPRARSCVTGHGR